ncbi:reverse transcriptase-like protein [candidate division WWE3 bacterium]|nr:reverse transcriptase-like protein [candidate division WWE3 bacterium]
MKSKNLNNKFVLFTDGGSRGNPGPAATGVFLCTPDKSFVKEMGTYLGKATNNEAEYAALVLGMKAALRAGAKQLVCYLDSELIVKQLRGIYKMKNARLKVFFDEIKALELELERVAYKHVPREKNKKADALVNEVLDNSKV